MAKIRSASAGPLEFVLGEVLAAHRSARYQRRVTYYRLAVALFGSGKRRACPGDPTGSSLCVIRAEGYMRTLLILTRELLPVPSSFENTPLRPLRQSFSQFNCGMRDILPTGTLINRARSLTDTVATDCDARRIFSLCLSNRACVRRNGFKEKDVPPETFSILYLHSLRVLIFCRHFPLLSSCRLR